MSQESTGVSLWSGRKFAETTRQGCPCPVSRAVSYPINFHSPQLNPDHFPFPPSSPPGHPSDHVTKLFCMFTRRQSGHPVFEQTLWQHLTHSLLVSWAKYRTSIRERKKKEKELNEKLRMKTNSHGRESVGQFKVLCCDERFCLHRTSYGNLHSFSSVSFIFVFYFSSSFSSQMCLLLIN